MKDKILQGIGIIIIGLILFTFFYLVIGSLNGKWDRFVEVEMRTNETTNATYYVWDISENDRFFSDDIVIKCEKSYWYYESDRPINNLKEGGYTMIYEKDGINYISFNPFQMYFGTE